MRPVVAIVQARTGSTRFPEKVIAPLLGEPMLLRQLERVSRAERIDEIVVATTDSPNDDVVEQLASRAGYEVFRGDEEDVLSRFHGAAARSSAKTVVRLTGDCPLIDPRIIDDVVSTYLAEHDDDLFVSNALSETYPDGMDTEVFSREMLERAHAEAQLPSEREHVTFYFWRTGLFRVHSIVSPEDLGDLRLTVDHAADLDLVRLVYERLYPADPSFGLGQIVEALREIPSLGNAHIGRNEGWSASLARDRRHKRV